MQTKGDLTERPIIHLLSIDKLLHCKTDVTFVLCCLSTWFSVVLAHD